MKNIRIHPIFVLFCLIMLLSGKGAELGAAAIAVTVHECGHYFCARKKGFVLKSLSIMPYGAVMYAEDGLPDREGWQIALAGPLINLLFALGLGSLWWFFPILYPMTKALFLANLSIGLFNLLPCYPLDGGRIVLCLVEKKVLCLKLLKGIGYFLSGASAVLFIVSLFYAPVLYLLFLSAMFFFGASVEVRKEIFRVKIAENYFVNDLSRPIEEKTVCVVANMTLGKITRELNGKCLYRIRVMKEGKEIAFLEGKAIEKMFYADRNETVERYLTQNNLVGVKTVQPLSM